MGDEAELSLLLLTGAFGLFVKPPVGVRGAGVLNEEPEHPWTEKAVGKQPSMAKVFILAKAEGEGRGKELSRDPLI